MEYRHTWKWPELVNQLEEIWMPAPSFEHYRVSNYGRVRNRHGRILKTSNLPAGYEIVNLWKNNKQYTFRMHRLVLNTFVGPCPEGMESLHIDDNPQNNRVDNLKYGTHAENIQAAVRRGTHYSYYRDGS